MVGTGAARADEQDQQGKGREHQHGANQTARQVPLGVFGFFGGQRHALYGEEKPDGIRNGRPHADIAERQERAGALGVAHRDVQQVGDVEVRHHGD